MPEAHNLLCRPAVVIVARPPTSEPSVIVGPVVDSTVGNAVAIGASACLPGQMPLAFLAHLSPEDARLLASKIIEAADDVDAAGGGDPIEVGESLGLGAGGVVVALPLPPQTTLSDPSTPPITPASEAGPHIKFASPEFVGIRTQVQHPTDSGKPPSEDPGMLGASRIAAPDGEFRVMLALTHADGTRLAAILDRNDYLSFGECFMQAGSVLGEGRPN